MKNRVFASLFVEAINKAGEDNGMANTISGMLNQIEQKEVVRRSRIAEKKTGKQETGQSSLRTKYPQSQPLPQEDNSSKNIDENVSSVFLRELKQKEYRKLVSE
ncbi:hypothetical protein [Erwinia pyrifoliae]|nr:hypothetical protein [Erwinia pyrifoliae]AUX71149.1 hypothetical protein CPI84_00550 [Erwinia pyrifoliae]MCA8875139.1 hypothetical protein [Erwinia pyrifoliae]UXK12225.1 hypothetical protein NYP80_18520 [Erwinia pyrifoliae]CAX57340.1 uncharacterized protein EpC_35600 [Erwinia pyrifoliae Ep1/96]CAY76209.1 hypothetical protein EPYR_03829 [Erwinia pyrifoliae DSM 12163]